MKAAQHAGPVEESEVVKSEITAVDAAVHSGTQESQASTAPISESEEIAKLAHSYWESRGWQGGSAEEDWLRAEREFHRRRQASVS